MDSILAEIVLLLGHFCLILLCVGAFLWERRAKSGGHPWIWLLLAVPMVILLLQHVTGAGAAVTDVFRQQAHQEGWYEERRTLQRQLTRLAPAVGGGLLVVLLVAIRKNWQRYLLPAVAFVYLVAYGAVQAVSLHAVDAVMRTRRFGVQTETWLELLGLLLVAVALVWSLSWTRRHSASASRT